MDIGDLGHDHRHESEGQDHLRRESGGTEWFCQFERIILVATEVTKNYGEVSKGKAPHEMPYLSLPPAESFYTKLCTHTPHTYIHTYICACILSHYPPPILYLSSIYHLSSSIYLSSIYLSIIYLCIYNLSSLSMYLSVLYLWSIYPPSPHPRLPLVVSCPQGSPSLGTLTKSLASVLGHHS